jgi:hypothetical protein
MVHVSNVIVKNKWYWSLGIELGIKLEENYLLHHCKDNNYVYGMAVSTSKPSVCVV